MSRESLADGRWPGQGFRKDPLVEDIVFLGMTGGETFVVAFVVIAIVSAPWWPRAGQRLLGGPNHAEGAPPAPPTDDDAR